MKKIFRSAVEILSVSLVALGISFAVRTFLVEPFEVSGVSMQPNFHDGDYLFVDHLTYGLRDPKRGEVTVFHFPGGEWNHFLIKRIIGLPGERVAVRRGQIVIYNDESPGGFLLREEYLKGAMTTGGDIDVALGDGEYFVLGDNRGQSYDSRSWGTLRKDEIVGMARFRIWPPKSLMVFAAPHYY